MLPPLDDLPPTAPDQGPAGSTWSDAEARLLTLPGVIAVRVEPGSGGAGTVDAVHLLTADEADPVQVSAEARRVLAAEFGVSVGARSVFTAGVAPSASPPPGVVASPVPPLREAPRAAGASPAPRTPRPAGSERALRFEDVELATSRTGGVRCRVVLRAADGTAVIGEAELPARAHSPSNVAELVARAALRAVVAHTAGDDEAPGGAPAGAPRAPALDGCRVVEQFGDRFVLVSLSARAGRATEYLTGAVRVDPGAGGEPAAAVLAVLDATNRWAARPSHRG